MAAAKQLGLFVEFSPEDMMLGMEETEDDEDLEAELLALTGEAGATGRKPAPKGQGEFVALGRLVAGTRWFRWVVETVVSSQLGGASWITRSLIPCLLQYSHQEAVSSCSYTCVMGSSLLL